jgi:hypothetical protein
MWRENHPPTRGRLECILPSLAREWLRIINGLLIAEDPEPALRSLNNLMCVNGGEGHKRRHAKCAKLTLTKLRCKPQVSVAFASVSILIDANGIVPQENTSTRVTFRQEERVYAWRYQKRGFIKEYDLLLLSK